MLYSINQPINQPACTHVLLHRASSQNTNRVERKNRELSLSQKQRKSAKERKEPNTIIQEEDVVLTPNRKHLEARLY